MKKIKLIIAFTFILGMAYINTTHAQVPCPTGLDIHIANDISGSVDSREFQQSKDFVSLLGANFGSAYGTANTETRVSISNWSAGSGRFVEYAFPFAGPNYATSISDILSYTTSARPFRGGTDVATALLRASEWVNQNPVTGRTTPKVIVLLTDASCFQVASNTSSIATQIKNSGVYIAVLAIDAAANCTNLAGTNIASPGGYFNAQDYATLQSQALSYINSLRGATCDPVNPIDPTPYDLTVSLSNFTRGNCDTTPTSSVNYQVNNTSNGESFSGNLLISFYNGNPTNGNAQYLFTQNAGSPTIAAGNNVTGSTSNTALTSASTLYAVVNFDGSVTGNAVPLSISNISNQLAVTGEGNASNNLSGPINRVDTGSCVSSANIDVRVTNSGLGCDNEVIYFVDVCNTGDADANIDPSTGITDYPPAAFTFVSKQTVIDPFVGTTLPAGACASYEYTYNLNNAVAGTTYNLSVDVKELQPLQPLPGNITLTAGQVHFIASIFDTDYSPAPAITGPAVQGAVAADGNPDPTVDIQGTLTTTGVTVRIPYTVDISPVSLPAFSQTVNVPAALTEDGIARDVTLSYPAQTLAVGSGFITATMQSVAGTLNVDKLDINGGVGDGSDTILVSSAGPTTQSVRGLLIAKFTLVVDNLGNTGEVHLRGITCQNDISVGTGAIVQMMYPYSGDYNTFNYSWCAREVTTAGNTWLDRNLGAYRVATAFDDAQSYGDLFQWGRKNDGHAKRVQRPNQAAEEGNATQGVMVNGTTSNRADVPANADFITVPFIGESSDWRVNPNNDLWNGLAAVNNPCPTGYRLPTNAELIDLDDSFFPNNRSGAIASPIKMPAAGYRQESGGQPIYTGNDTGSEQSMWSGDASSNFAWFLIVEQFESELDILVRAIAIPVRCVKE